MTHAPSRRDTTGEPHFYVMFKKEHFTDNVSDKRDRMVLISFHVPQTYLEALDELVRLGVYPSRSEAVRAALRELLARYKLDGET